MSWIRASHGPVSFVFSGCRKNAKTTIPSSIVLALSNDLMLCFTLGDYNM